LFERMARYETRSVPTLVMLRTSPCAKGLYEKLTQLLLAMHRAGVSIMAGTDSGKPGEALHEELELLVAAGLSPAQALRSATVEPARYLDAAESLGAVEQGRTADLVLLDADPLADIRNTRKIAAVVLDGKYLSKARLIAMKMRK
jgi:imidazolonepropionase-like amidohydrolase